MCSIKAISPPFNYGGEPSVSMGIMSQLPSSHLSIHRVPAKLSNGVMPHGEYHCWLRLLFAVALLLTRHPFGSTDKPVDAMPPLSCLASRYGCRSQSLRHRLRVPSPEPCPAAVPVLWFGKALENLLLFLIVPIMLPVPPLEMHA